MFTIFGTFICHYNNDAQSSPQFIINVMNLDFNSLDICFSKKITRSENGVIWGTLRQTNWQKETIKHSFLEKKPMIQIYYRYKYYVSDDHPDSDAVSESFYDSELNVHASLKNHKCWWWVVCEKGEMHFLSLDQLIENDFVVVNIVY